jgi:hypothetical protein
MEAPTPTRGAPATLQHIPAAALPSLEAALESEAKVAMLKETNAELIRYGMTGDATPRSRMDVPPASGHADGDSLDAGLLPRPSVRQTVYALPIDRNASQGPVSQSAPGTVIDALQEFRAHHGLAPGRYIHRPIPVAVVMNRISFTTIFTISNSLMCNTVNGRVGRTNRSAFPARHIVINGRRRTGTPATTVVMQPCTTKFAIGMGLMCSTVNGRVGRTSRSAFPAQHIVFSRRRREET